MTSEWKEHLRATSIVRSEPDRRTGAVAVYERDASGGLRYVRSEPARRTAAAANSS
jgi:hypothetical protein